MFLCMLSALDLIITFYTDNLPANPDTSTLHYSANVFKIISVNALFAHGFKRTPITDYIDFLSTVCLCS